MAQVKGAFDVKVVPQADPTEFEPAIGRMTIDKQFHGDLDATSKGQMLSAMSPIEGSGGYVAIERVNGALSGRRGSFVLQHIGTMDRGKPHLTITVVPDSGTDQLTGISGSLTIDIVDGKHYYAFDYSIAKKE